MRARTLFASFDEGLAIVIAGLHRVPGHERERAQVRVAARERRIDAQSQTELALGLVELPRLGEADAEIGVTVAVRGSKRHDLLIFGNGGRALTGFAQGIRERVMRLPHVFGVQRGLAPERDRIGPDSIAHHRQHTEHGDNGGNREPRIDRTDLGPRTTHR